MGMCIGCREIVVNYQAVLFHACAMTEGKVPFFTTLIHAKGGRAFLHHTILSILIITLRNDSSNKLLISLIFHLGYQIRIRKIQIGVDELTVLLSGGKIGAFLFPPLEKCSG